MASACAPETVAAEEGSATSCTGQGDHPPDVDQVEDIFRCSVCTLPFDNTDRIPKMLPCHHTFCLPCLRSINETQRSSRGHMECPMCRMQMAPDISLDELATNFYLSRFREMLKLGVRHQEPSCSNASGSKSGELGCDGGQDGMCSKHGGAPRRLWCETCEQAICGLCQRNDHHTVDSAEHHVTSVQEHKAKLLKNTLQLLKEAGEKLDQLRQKSAFLSNVKLDSIDASIAKLMSYACIARQKLQDQLELVSEPVLDVYCSELEEFQLVLTEVHGITIGEILRVQEDVLTTTLPTLTGLVEQLDEAKKDAEDLIKLQVVLAPPRDAESTNHAPQTLYCAFCGRPLRRAMINMETFIAMSLSEADGEVPSPVGDTPSDSADMFARVCEFCNSKVIEA